ncbi:MAG: DUF4123 domain-containing protein [Myxococcales bacterium]|nr:DUF4123 domain-containing protein [Myxococcales bacterium]
MTAALIAQVAHGPRRFNKAVVQPGQRLVVGSAPDVDWPLADLGLAAHQLELRWDGETGQLRHLGGAEPTWFEGQAVDRCDVGHGAWIRCGAADLTLARERHSPPDDPVEPAVLAAAARPLARLRAVQTPLYAVVDASRSLRIPVLLRESPDPMRSLYDGVQADTLAESAPYLVTLTGGHLLADLVHEGWKRRWCTFLTAPASLAEDDVRRHLRKFLMVQLERTGETAYFRYYDPYVLRSYLASCAPDERRAFLGPLTFLALDDDGVIHTLTA